MIGSDSNAARLCEICASPAQWRIRSKLCETREHGPEHPNSAMIEIEEAFVCNYCIPDKRDELKARDAFSIDVAPIPGAFNREA